MTRMEQAAASAVRQGTIIRAVAGFYYVYSGGTVYECRARGIFKKQGITPLVGDEVELAVIAEPGMQPSASSPEMGVGSVDGILPRLNSFERPPVANVELFVLVASVKHPDPSLLMLDKVTAAAERKGAKVLVCVSKTDLAKKGQLEQIEEHFKGVYPVVLVSAKNAEISAEKGEDEQDGLAALKEALRGKKAALAGPSGVGKSTLANLLLGEEKSQTGEISQRLRRGKNTTRHSELFAGDGFFLFDTPGFTSFELPDLTAEEAQQLFPEISKHAGDCRFSDCRHLAEPDCAVKAAVEAGEISRSRYENYVTIVKSIKQY